MRLMDHLHETTIIVASNVVAWFNAFLFILENGDFNLDVHLMMMCHCLTFQSFLFFICSI